MNPVIEWFGDDFTKLDPLLQRLHHHGGTLSGEVNIEFGNGIGGLIGRRLAGKLGIPNRSGQCQLDVSISHKDGALHWARRFDHLPLVVSIFVPYGSYPGGHWNENTGVVSLVLGVEIIDGGWYWMQRAIKILGIPFPLFLTPATHAYKRVENNLYEFSVTLTLPVIGKLLSYSGALSPVTKTV